MRSEVIAGYDREDEIDIIGEEPALIDHREDKVTSVMILPEIHVLDKWKE